MTSQSITPVASNSKVTDNAFTNVEGESTDKDAAKQTTNSTKKKKGIGLVTGWLRMVEPRKVPYFPQNRDKIVYLRQAHECYLKEVVDRKIFDVTESDKLWVQMKIDVFEYLLVTNISFEKYPTRVACLEVRRINQEEEPIGPVFQLKYHDMGDVVDFLVLKHIFNEGLQMKWNRGDRFRCLVGNKWFFGTIISKEPFEGKYPNSPFKCFEVKWDDEIELDQLSPWELQSTNINKGRLPKNHGECVEVLNIEIVNMRYKSSPEWKATMKNIIPEFDSLMKLPISNCFVEIKNDPIYDALVSYPIDLSTIKERLEKHFYRRSDALLMDIFYLKDNAEKHKPEKFFEEAKLIAEVCKDILNNGECISSFAKLEKFLEKFNSSESDESSSDNEYKPHGSYNKRGRPPNYKNNWKIGCKQLLNTLWNSEDMLPFRQPVCREDYPDYYEMIKSPICFEQIHEKFNSNQYESPKEMFDDIKLLITNSRKYNKDIERAIYHATTRVSDLFEELKKQINCKKESPRKRMKKNSYQKKNKSDEFIPPSRVKPKHSCPKTGERVIYQKEKEKECNTAKIATQQKGSINRKNSIQDETNADEKRIDSKNNNYEKNLSVKLLIQKSNTNLAVDTSHSTVVMQNKGKGDKSSPKKNIQEKDIGSNKKKLIQCTEEENSNKSPINILNISSEEINAKNLPQETHLANPNEDIRMEVDKGDNKVNKCKNSESDNGCEIIENDSTNQLNVNKQSTHTSLTQKRDSTDSIIVIDIENDDEEEHQQVSKSFEKVENLAQVNRTENSDQDASKTSQKKSNFKKSLASTKAKKRMQYKYHCIFQPRPHRSCVTCKNIRQIYLDHVRSRHF